MGVASTGDEAVEQFAQALIDLKDLLGSDSFERTVLPSQSPEFSDVTAGLEDLGHALRISASHERAMQRGVAPSAGMAVSGDVHSVLLTAVRDMKRELGKNAVEFTKKRQRDVEKLTADIQRGLQNLDDTRKALFAAVAAARERKIRQRK